MRYVFIIFSAILLFSCGSQKDIVRIESESDSIDSVEYILIVDELGFESWMATNTKRVWYYTYEYYQAWNRIYVIEFNQRVLTGADYPFVKTIHYDNSIDYGLELNYKLYWYFMFIQKKYNVSLLASGF